MKSYKFLLGASIALAFSGCIADEPLYSSGEGTIFLSTRINSDVKVSSRADLGELQQSCDIWIANSKGIIYKFNGTDEVPSDGLKLVSGNYTALVWAGDSVPASWDDRFFKGVQDFSVASGDKKSVEVVARIANSAVSVEFDESLDGVLSNYSMTVGHSQGKLTYTGETASDTKGYFMMNSRDKDLTYTLKGTLADGSEYTRTDIIPEAKAATWYKLKVTCPETSTEIGGAYFDIDIDETTIDMPEEITIDAAPEIRGINFDLARPVRAKKGELGKKSLWITATSEVKSLILECEQFSELLGIGGNAFDFFTMPNQEAKDRIFEKGINYTYVENEDPDYFDSEGNNLLLPTIKLSFEDTFTDDLYDGTYNITVSVTDKNGKSAKAVLNIVISDDPVAAQPVENEDQIWATKAYVTINVTKDGVEDPYIKYRKEGQLAWSVVDSPKSSRASYPINTELTFELTGLEPGTTYEYCAASGDFESTSIQKFTTESADQIPNAGFEEWYQDGKLYFPQASASAASYWGSGNTALKSYTMFVSECPTSPESTVKHSGNYSARLKSINVAGVAFAAGNIFVGDFVRTDGTSGVLGWGRPWTSRPAKLKGYVKYTPQTVSTSKTSPNVKKGDLDKGAIYIGLLDGSVELSEGGNIYPVVIKNKESARQLFDKNAANVIAYGELIFDKATDGEGLVEFEIPIDYRSDKKPKYLMLTASSSLDGDYFQGGEGSTMYIDDFTLVYE